MISTYVRPVPAVFMDALSHYNGVVTFTNTKMPIVEPDDKEKFYQQLGITWSQRGRGQQDSSSGKAVSNVLVNLISRWKIDDSSTVDRVVEA